MPFADTYLQQKLRLNPNWIWSFLEDACRGLNVVYEKTE